MSTKRGVALIWVLVLSTVLLITSTTMVSYIIKESQFSVRIEESTQVYAAAKSGIDWAKWKVDTKKPTDIIAPSYSFDLLGSDGIQETVVTINEADKLIISASEYNKVVRKLKYKITEVQNGVLDLRDKVNTNPNGKWIGANTESFSMQFDFWGGSAPFALGVYNPTGSNSLYMNVDATGATSLKANIGSVPHQSDPLNKLISAQTDLFYYRAKIKYIKNTAAKLSVETFNITNMAYSCLDDTTLDLSGLNLGDLPRLYITSSGTIVYTEGGTYTDGTYVTVTIPGAIRYIDNIEASFISSNPVWAVATPINPVNKGSVTGAGSYLEGSDVTLVASNTVSGYLFDGWSSTTTGSCPVSGLKDATVSFIISDNVSCTANYVASPILVVNVNNSAYGTVAGGGTYPISKIVSISATPASGYAFSSWSGATCPANLSTANPANVTMPKTVPSITTCTANFIELKYSLNVTKTGDGTGTITATSVLPASSDAINCGSDCSGSYKVGTQVILSATPDSHSVRREWSGGGCTGYGATCTVNIDSAKSVNMRFARTYFDFNTGVLSDYYTGMQWGGGIDLLPGGTNWGTPDGVGRSLFLNGVYAGPCTVGWQDPNDAYITKLIYVPPTATYLSFQAAGGVTGNPNNSYNDAILAGVLNSGFSYYLGGPWQANSNGTNTLISGHTSTPPGYAGWYWYSTDVSAYRGQDVYFYVRSHVGCWWSAVIIDNITVW